MGDVIRPRTDFCSVFFPGGDAQVHPLKAHLGIQQNRMIRLSLGKRFSGDLALMSAGLDIPLEHVSVEVSKDATPRGGNEKCGSSKRGGAKLVIGNRYSVFSNLYSVISVWYSVNVYWLMVSGL